MVKRAKFFAAIIICLALGGGIGAEAQVPGQAAPPFLNPDGFSIQSNSMKGPNGRPLLYGGTTPGANWFFADMGAPGDLPPLSYKAAPGGGVWSSRQPWAAVSLRLAAGVPTEMLRQNTAMLSCLTPGGQAKEYDLGIWPNGENPGYPSAVNPVYGSNRNFPRLSQLASLTISGVFTYDGASRPLPVSPCAVNHGGISLGIILIDNAVTPRQMFWYSLQLANACLPISADDPGRDFASCSAGIRHPQVWWYWTGRAGPGRQVSQDAAGALTAVHFAVGDIMPAFGLREITGHQPVPLSLDFLPRLAALIGSGKDGIDPDLSHWRLAGTGFGQSLWGDTAMGSTWQGFVPRWTLQAATPP
jgi:hypothetical protein